jgi:hypothetical protein
VRTRNCFCPPPFASAIALLSLAGCDLYFGSASDVDAVAPSDDGGSAAADADPAPVVCGGGSEQTTRLAAGTVRFASRFATSQDELAWDVVRAPNNAVYLAGQSGQNRMLLLCFEPDGTLGAHQTFGGNGSDRLTGVTVAADGTPIVAGLFGSTSLTLGGTTLTNVGGFDGVVARLALANAPQHAWAVSVATTGGDAAVNAIARTPDDGVVVAGTFAGSGTLGSMPIASVGLDDFIVAKLAANGSVSWLHTFGSNANDRAVGVAVDAEGRISVLASTSSASIDVGGGPLTGDTEQALLLQLAADGSYQWATRMSPGNTTPAAVAVDEIGHVFIAGIGTNFPTASGTDNGGFVASYTSTGMYRWTSVLHSSIPRVWGLASANGKTYVNGVFFTPATWNSASLPSGSGAYKYVVELDDSGNRGWILYGDGPTLGGALDVSGDLLVAGPYLGSLVMGTATLSADAPHDVFLMSVAR